jgi:hypothetical protein
MTNAQLYLAIGLPIFVNAAMFGLLVMYMNARLDSIERRFDARFEGMDGRFEGIGRRFDARFEVMDGRFEGINQRFEAINQRFEGIDRRFDAINQRFDDMRDLWRAELHRVEEVLDARLKHIEEARR